MVSRGRQSVLSGPRGTRPHRCGEAAKGISSWNLHREGVPQEPSQFVDLWTIWVVEPNMPGMDLKGWLGRSLAVSLSLALFLASGSGFLVRAEQPATPRPGTTQAHSEENCACAHCGGESSCCCKHGHSPRESRCDRSPENSRSAEIASPAAGPVLLVCLPKSTLGSDLESRPWTLLDSLRRFPPHADSLLKVPIARAG